MPKVDTAPVGHARPRATARKAASSPFALHLARAALALVAVACGGAERPGTQEVSGSADHMVSEATASRNGGGTCEHGTVVECKVWITDVDCFTGLAVCDHGELSGCMDADAAEATLEAMEQAVE